jgi:hypothetical protein
MSDVPENDNVVSIRDFMNHETRISLVERAIINIDKRAEEASKQFEQFRKEFREDIRDLRAETKMHFRWTMGGIFGLIVLMIGKYFF